MDPDNWDNPEEFRPERFLSEDGKTVVKPDQFIPFGVGQRMCLGDQLAEKELFIFFASLLHTFDLKPQEDKPLPNLRGVAAVTITPTDFEVICSPRSEKSITALKSSLENGDSELLASCKTFY